jgi:hypothetical protein
MARAEKHVLTETDYCATMFEHPKVNGRYRCTAAGRYMDTDGRVICERCAVDLVVVKLTDVPKLINLVDRLVELTPPMTNDLRAQLRTLVSRLAKVSP